MEGLIDAGPLVHFRELTERGFDFDLDQLFEFGLARVLDGLSLFVEVRDRA
ncbi:hypothetical protein [Actinoplanes solisilvae]|uniref:hypothetical protein n=1 Tax=Actinoplanes solisilvae TaxID=2486853 RepID=UPI0013E3BFC9|nr:hypothetical protein [Actinoplanes solisilvae]